MSRWPDPETCGVPRCGEPAVSFCDFPVDAGGWCRCRMPLCRAHRNGQRFDADYCPAHQQTSQMARSRRGRRERRFKRLLRPRAWAV